MTLQELPIPVRPSVPEGPANIRLERPKGWQPVNVRELWEFRELLAFLAWRDVKVRYRQTLLGIGWAVLQPALMMVVFAVFFGRLAKVDTGGVPYPLFVYIGLLPWTFFSTAIASAGNSVVGSERLITKIYFPRLAIPLAAVGAAVVDFVVALGLLIVLMIWYGVPPGPSLLVVPVVFAGVLVAALAVGTSLASLTVAYRDFRYVTPFLIQLWLFATPTVYLQPTTGTVNSLLLTLNPMSGLVGAFRAACLGQPIAWGTLAACVAVSAAALVAGCMLFRRMEQSFADVI